MHIAFIGGGGMGEAIIAGLLAKEVARPADIIVSDISPERRSLLSDRYGVATTADNRQAASGAETLVLAIKPQTLHEVMGELNGRPAPGQLVISIVAGATLETLTRGLGHKVVVRAMPNAPARVGQGMTVWTASDAVTKAQREVARRVLGALGKEIMADERYLDMATAVSGSGPAYIFLVIEALIDAAVHIGLPRDMASELVVETVLGAGRLAKESGEHPSELRNMVTSPGGTTAEGLLKLEEGGLRAAISQAVIAAYEKAISLGRSER